MSKKVVIISSTPVRGGKGNSEILCEEFARGAREMGHDYRSGLAAESLRDGQDRLIN